MSGEGQDGGSLLLNQPIVIDNGTGSIKAGFAGSSKPKVREGGIRIYKFKIASLNQTDILAL
jgi:hypothetical protein